MKIKELINKLIVLLLTHGNKRISIVEMDSGSNMMYSFDDDCMAEHMDLTDEIEIYIKGRIVGNK